MTIKYIDRVFETSQSSGTGTINLDGPVTNFQSFALAGNNARVGYMIDEPTKWEIGIGTVLTGSPNQLARTKVLSSSNSNALVNFGTGNVKNVRLLPIASLLVGRDEGLNFSDLMGDATGSAANAHTVKMPVSPLAYTNGAVIMYRVTLANTAAAVTVNLTDLNGNLLGAKALKINGADPGAGLLSLGTLIVGVFNKDTDAFDVISVRPKVDLTADVAGVLPVANGGAVSVPVRQTVLQSPVDTSGLPTFLPASSSNLSLTTQNITSGQNALIATASQGVLPALSGAVNRVGFTAINLTWAGLSPSTTNYLFLDIAADGTVTPGFSTLAPVYQWGGAPSVANGQFTFNIQQMTGYVGNGSTAVPVYRVYVGEASTSASAVTAATAYALMGRYISIDSSWANSSRYDFASNLGFSYGVETRLHMINQTAEGGFVPNDVLTFINEYGGQNFDSNMTATIPHIIGRNLLTVNFGAISYVMHRTTGASAVGLTPANWKARVLAWRTW